MLAVVSQGDSNVWRAHLRESQTGFGAVLAHQVKHQSHFSRSVLLLLNMKIKIPLTILGGKKLENFARRQIFTVWFCLFQKEMQISRKWRMKPVYRYSSDLCH